MKPTKQDSEPTIQDVFVALNIFSSNMDEELATIKSTMVTKDYLDAKLTNFVTKNDLTDGLNKQKTELVTKDYLDDKLSDLRGEFFVSQSRHVPSGRVY